MAFFGKARNLLRQTVTRHINHEISASNSSFFQIIRCMSSSKLFVGGISYQTDDASLQEAFNKYGDVIEARVIVDRETGRSRGFGFVTYGSSEDASSAIQALDGKDLHGRIIRVNYANERPRPSYGGGFGSGGSYGGGNYGNTPNYGNFGADNYRSGGNNYASGGADGYGSGGGNYGGNFAGNNYPSGSNTGGYDASVDGSYPRGNSYDTGNGINYGGDNQSFGVAGGGGGSDNYGGSGGIGNSFPSSSYDGNGADQFGSGDGNSMADANGGYGQDGQIGGNYRDGDDEPDDYANRRA